MAERENLTPVGFRLPDPLIERIDAWCQRMEQQLPGSTMSRSNAIRILLEKALAAEGLPAEQSTKGKAKR